MTEMRRLWPIVVVPLTACGAYAVTPTWAGRLQVEGLLLEVIGALVAAQSLSNTNAARIFAILSSALVRGKYASGKARRLSSNSSAADSELRALQGLSFIALGFVLQLAGTLVAPRAG